MKRFLAVLLTAALLVPTASAFDWREWVLVETEGRCYNGERFSQFDSLQVEIIEQDGRYGAINHYGDQILPCIYGYIYPDDYIGVLQVTDAQMNLMGIFDFAGNVIIPMEYERIFWWTEDGDYYACKKDGKWGLLDRNATIIIPFSYAELYTPDETGWLHANLGEDQWGMINLDNEVMIPFQYTDVGIFHGDLIIVQQGGKYGIINRQNELVVPIEYDYLHYNAPYDDEPAYYDAKKNGLSGTLYADGSPWIPCEYWSIMGFHNGIAMASREAGQWYVINENNETVLPIGPNQRMEEVVTADGEGFSYYSYFVVSDLGVDDGVTERRLYSNTGALLRTQKGQFAEYCTEGRLAYEEKGLWGYLDEAGQVAIPAQFQYADIFHRSVAVVHIEHKAGLINTAGELLVPAEYDEIYIYADTGEVTGQRDGIGYYLTGDHAGEPVPEHLDSRYLTPAYDKTFSEYQGEHGMGLVAADGAVVTSAIYESFSRSSDRWILEKPDGTQDFLFRVPLNTAFVRRQTIELDGTPTELQTYALRDEQGNETNYVRLRDMAYLLDGTAAQFNVAWDGGISLAAGEGYTSDGSELAVPFRTSRSYIPADPTVQLNGAAATMEGIVLTDTFGGGYTYYKLRDLAALLGFTADWSAERGIFVKTA